MRITGFKAGGIHGYLSFNIRFRGSLTFLTGINGSGKTSAINAMIALLTPDFMMLADLEYKSISVDVEHDGAVLSIAASSADGDIALSVTGVDLPFTFTKFIPDQDLPSYKQFEGEGEYYSDLLSLKSSNATLRVIASLPTPMFLGIDRRTAFAIGRPGLTARQARFGRNIFSKSLAGSLAAAASLAETRYRDALIQAGRLTERFQREMLLGLLGAGEPEAEFSSGTRLRLPTHDDMREILRVRKDISGISDIMKLPVSEVQKRLVPLLDRLRALAQRIPLNADLDKLLSAEHGSSEIVSAIVAWGANQSHLERIKFISGKVAAYNELKSRTLNEVNEYQRLVNKFFEESGKVVNFGENGYIGINIAGVDDPKPISSLSSGEAQIFVILTHLALNPTAQLNNVFIIDEPELSLHVHWQEMFVESVMAANPNIQYILATHSPSIILDKVENCIDISRKGGNKTVKRGRA